MKLPLEKRVAGSNQAAADAIRLHSTLFALFEPYLGQKVTKADGNWIKPIADGLQAIQLPSHWTCGAGRYGAAVEISVCITAEGFEFCEYRKANFHIADFSGNTLAKVYDQTAIAHLRSDWTAQEVETKKAEVKSLKEKLSKLESSLGPFQYE